MKSYKQNQVVSLSILGGGVLGGAIGAVTAHGLQVTPDAETTVKVGAGAAVAGAVIAGCVAVALTGPSKEEIEAQERRERIRQAREDALARRKLGPEDPALLDAEKEAKEAISASASN